MSQRSISLHRPSTLSRLLETLEQRRLLSASVGVAGNAIVVTGTDGNDQISVDYDAETPTYLVSVNNEEFTFASNRLKRLRIDTGAGNDRIRIESTVTLDAKVDAGDGNDIVWGGNGRNRFSGGAGNDQIVGGDGNDFFHGGDGDDYLLGLDGNDRIWGQDGVDMIFAGGGTNFIHGGDGEDAIFGSDGDKLLH